MAGSRPVNRGLGLATSDPEIVGDLIAKLFERDFEASEEMMAPVPVGLPEEAAETIANRL